ncbi:diaminopimelate epimerase [Chryseomicrobium palamuruense]|uniref:Diaminopimelate epimerase n=1 Tax=Chryseomicrobium palamuruense TaxID=682973 RepID=A0ABV8UZ43_9BACL
MELTFTKMQGAGNDYVYINGFDYTITPSQAEKLAVKLADRHFGIGGDGLVIIDPSDIADAKMRMYNADGSEGNMCGNAIRCVAKYVYDYAIAKKEQLMIESKSGVKPITVSTENNQVHLATVEMGAANFNTPAIPVLTEETQWIDYSFETAHGVYQVTALSMGNPHLVTFMKDIHTLRLSEIGPLFEHHSAFPERINTEFVEVHSNQEISMRVWERGSGETLACGTGACAAVAAAVVNGYCLSDSWVTVHLLGGDLEIYYSKEQIYMKGPAVEVFTGQLNISL